MQTLQLYFSLRPERLLSKAFSFRLGISNHAQSGRDKRGINRIVTMISRLPGPRVTLLELNVMAAIYALLSTSES
jgi:hypothetical protein